MKSLSDRFFRRPPAGESGDFFVRSRFFVEIRGKGRYNELKSYPMELPMDNGECKVSVLCMAYNHAPYIRQALEGFAAQRPGFAFEVLINDDASTDGTADIIREYAGRYPEILRPLFQEKNQYSQGVDIIASLLVPAARGEYCAFCEGDDYWTDPDKLRLQAEFLDTHPEYAACVHNSMALTVGSSAPAAPLFPSGGDRDIPFDLMVKGPSHAFHTSSVLVRRQWLETLPEFYRIALAHGFGDYPQDLWFCLNGKIRFLDRCMSVYRIHSNPGAWSSGVDRNYGKLMRFVTGELEMLQAMLPLLSPAQAESANREILLRRYELLELKGDAAGQLQPPFDEIYRSKDFSYKLKHFIKRSFPRLHSLYRRRRGYGD